MAKLISADGSQLACSVRLCLTTGTFLRGVIHNRRIVAPRCSYGRINRSVLLRRGWTSLWFALGTLKRGLRLVLMVVNNCLGHSWNHKRATPTGLFSFLSKTHRCAKNFLWHHTYKPESNDIISKEFGLVPRCMCWPYRRCRPSLLPLQVEDTGRTVWRTRHANQIFRGPEA